MKKETQTTTGSIRCSKQWSIKQHLQCNLASKEIPHIITIVIVAVLLAQAIMVLSDIFEERSLLRQYDVELKKYIIMDQKAKPLEDILSGAPGMAGLLLVLIFSILPVYSFLKYYSDSKGILTILRLPQRRIWIYLINGYQAVMGALLGWFLSFLMVLSYAGIYNAAIPDACKSAHLWKTFWENPRIAYLYPAAHPMEFLRPVCFCILMPVLALTVVIVIKSGRRFWIGTIPLLLTGVTIVATTSLGILSCFCLMGGIGIAMATGVYYLNQILIV